MVTSQLKRLAKRNFDFSISNHVLFFVFCFFLPQENYLRKEWIIDYLRKLGAMENFSTPFDGGF